jgi:hypothetical protein
LALIALAALGVASCEVPTTQILVRIDSDLSWGPTGMIQSVVLDVRRDGAYGRLRSRRTTALGQGTARQPLPLWVTIVSADDADESPLWIEALACRTPDGCTHESAHMVQRASVYFAPGEPIKVLPLDFASVCASSTCSLTERCDVSTGACVSIDAQRNLQEYRGDLTSHADAGAPDVADGAISLTDASIDAPLAPFDVARDAIPERLGERD